MNDSLTNHAIIAGFGVPGRAAADWLDDRGISHCVVELNPATVTRCGKSGVPIIAGDVCREDVLRQAGIEHATGQLQKLRFRYSIIFGYENRQQFDLTIMQPRGEPVAQAHRQ